MDMSALKTNGVDCRGHHLAGRETLCRAFLLLIALLSHVGGLAAKEQAASVPTQVYEGMITDTHCGAKHSAAIGLAAADCTRVCVHGGEHFALVDGDKVYLLEDDLETLKKMAGQRVKIVGTRSGNAISVVSVSADK